MALDYLGDLDSAPAARSGDASASELARFLSACVAFLQRYDAMETGSPERRDLVFATERALPSLSFDGRLEPRKTVVRRWRTLVAEQPLVFQAAVAHFLKSSPRPGLEELTQFLSLFAETGSTLADSLAFLALDRLERLGGPSEGSGATAALVSTLSGDGSAIISLLERLREADLLQARPLYAAGRRIARWDPARLNAFFSVFAADLATAASADGPDVLRFFLKDLIERAGAYSVLSAVTDVEPQRCPPLFRAAFAGGNPLYRICLRPIESVVERAGPAMELFVAFGEQRFDMRLLPRPRDDADWIAKVRSVTHILPWYELPPARSAPEASPAQAPTARSHRAKAESSVIGSLTAMAAKALGIPYQQAPL